MSYRGNTIMDTTSIPKAKGTIIVVGAGPVGALAAIYAARRGYTVEVYELRSGKPLSGLCFQRSSQNTLDWLY
jgi:flavin-dependent dehydrogenase